jgi:predicted nuclease of restriction endonuclease-like (RecB) superfamily
MNVELKNNDLFLKIAELLQTARQTVVRAVNQTMVYTYYEIGRMIVEDEQKGKERAEYGKQVLKELSKKLTIEFGKGFSVENLDRMRYFYKTYSSSNSSTPLTKSETTDNRAIYETASRKFTLSWSHYLKLMRIDNPDERRFYEIEALNNNWSVRELQLVSIFD